MAINNKERKKLLTKAGVEFVKSKISILQMQKTHHFKESTAYKHFSELESMYEGLLNEHLLGRK